MEKRGLKPELWTECFWASRIRIPQGARQVCRIHEEVSFEYTEVCPASVIVAFWIFSFLKRIGIRIPPLFFAVKKQYRCLNLWENMV
jgi:hypothetical protein